jgi:hypothetical protein
LAKDTIHYTKLVDCIQRVIDDKGVIDDKYMAATSIAGATRDE